MSAKLKSVIFIVALCVVCSLVLTFGATALKAPQERNMLLDRQANILRAANLLPNGKVRPEIIHELYAELIGEYYVAADGSLSVAADAAHTLHIYTAYDTDTITRVILPFTVKGAWGDISGYLALNPDLDTVAGFTVYDHNETAGLGAEIAQAWFLDQWRGKKLHDINGIFQGIAIAKGSADTGHPGFEHAVDGISGATNTGKALSRGLRLKLEQDLPVLRKIDWGQSPRPCQMPNDICGAFEPAVRYTALAINIEPGRMHFLEREFIVFDGHITPVRRSRPQPERVISKQSS